MKKFSRAAAPILRMILCTGLLSGCASSSRSRYGTTARYSPADRAWIAQKAPGEPAWTFRDPLNGCVIRCRSQLENSLAMNAANSAVANHNSGARIGTGILVTLPLAVPGILLLLPAILVSEGLSGPSAKEHRARGDASRNALEFDQAIDEYMLAYAQGDRAALESAAAVYIEVQDLPAAQRVREQLICSGGLKNDAEWTAIESWLATRGRALSCSDDSKAPLEIPWTE